LSDEEVSKRKGGLLKKIKELLIAPNLVIETKNGYQIIWFWLIPIPLPAIEDRLKANEYYKQIVAGFGKVTDLYSLKESAKTF